MEHSGACLEQLLMRAAVAPEVDYAVQRKEEPDLRQTDKQELQGKRCFISSLKGHRAPNLKVPQVKSACCGV